MNKLPIGIIVSLSEILEKGFNDVISLGLTACQLNCWDDSYFTKENAEKVLILSNGKIQITSLWVGWPGPAEWNFIDGPQTLGLVPTAFRSRRLECLKKGAQFASWLGIKDIVTHVGFIPENPSTTEYRELLIAVSEIGKYCKELHIYFNFETGQETPITLLRTIQDTGLSNLGINLDPGNLLMYGKGNPIDAVDIYRSYVRGVHIKDGDYPTDPRFLGEEKSIGEGRVDFLHLISKLIEYGFCGGLIIEREISGPQQIEDILKAKKIIENILEKVNK